MICSDLPDFNAVRVLVTGGSGFIGSHIVSSLLKNGADVLVTEHRSHVVYEHDRLEKITADISDLQQCERAVEGVDMVVHAAGVVGSAGITPSDEMIGINYNLQLTGNILQTCWKAGVSKVLVFGSSTSYPPAEHPVTENELWSGQPHPAYFGYGWMRRYIECLAEYVSQKSSTDIIVIRPSAVYGPNDNFDPASGHVIPSLITRALSKEDPFIVWGTGNEVRDFIYAKDFAKGCLQALRNLTKFDVINIAKGEGVSVRELAEHVLRITGHERADLQFDANKSMTLPIRLMDISRAKNELGFTPAISIKDGLELTVQWRLNHLR